MKINKINIVLVTLIIAIIIGYFATINLVLDDKITNQLRFAEEYAKNKNWNGVLRVSKDIKKFWNKYKYLILFNFGSSEFSDFEFHINHVMVGAEAKQLDTTLESILDAQSLWKNMKRLVPEP